jgi:hypothetical protein
MIHRNTILAMFFLEVIVMTMVVPGITAGIAYAAWKGLPKNFSREMYWTAFVSTGVPALFLLVVAQRTDLEGLRHILTHYTCAFSGLLLLGVSWGCGAAILTYRGPMFSRLSQPKD